MDGRQTSLALSDSLCADLLDPDCSNIGRFEDMPREELDCLFEQISESCTGPPFSSQDPPSPDAVPSSSLSSRDTDPQFTPSSTTYDLISDQGNLGDSPIEFRTDYTNSPIAGFEQVSPYSSRSSEYSHISQSIPRRFDGSSSSMQPSREPSHVPMDELVQQQWLSFDTSTSDNGDYVEVPLYPISSHPIAVSANTFAPGQPTTMTLTDRTVQQSQAWAPVSLQSHTYGQCWGTMHEQPAYSQPESFTQRAAQGSQIHNNLQAQLNQTVVCPPMPANFTEPQLGSQVNMPLLQSNHSIPHGIAPSLSGRNRQSSRASLAHSTRLRFPDHPAIAAEQKSPTSPRRTQRPIAVANPEDIPASARLHVSHDSKPKQGGRKKNSHLNQDARDRSSRMRKKGACWRCKLQRDPCPDDGTPCGRCVIGSQKGQLYFFECNRSKLPDFVMDFLPPSYTIMHSKQNIEDCVKDQVLAWDYTRPVEVCLTSGYGQPLRWILYEFKPATLELLGQFQYLQNIHTRQPERCEKWSPPLGITKLEPSDDWHFKNYLDDLMSDECLEEFPWICFEEESQIDDFQATMLAMICQLYRNTCDVDLQQLLHKIIRMLIVTYIMGHTLTITQETLPMVHAHLRSSYKPVDLAPHTSPRLANRQLKFFFHVLRNQMYEDILKWQQATLHTSGGKNTTWLSTFIVMLAFAMVLEEAQRTIQIQADAKWRKRERSYDEAQQEASNACERIDARFQLLIGLFQCKYRDKKWVRGGSFGPQTPRLRHPVEHDFCTQLRELLEERQNHLRSRKDVPFSSQTQCQYTTRLVARFLLPFLDLPC